MAGAMAVALALGWAAAGAADGRIAFAPFALVDADGNTVRSTDFAGKWLLIYFGYTRCSDQCPTALSTLAAALDEIGSAADFIQPIFITVDPEHDKGPILRRFTAAFDKRLIGLGGASEAIAAAAKTLGIKVDAVRLGSDDYVIDHSTTLSLVDPSGRSAETFAMAEPYQIAAKLISALDRAGVSLSKVNNIGAFH
jgi:protein SCO1/2